MRLRAATTHEMSFRTEKLCKCLSLERLKHTKRFSAHTLTQASWWGTLTSRDSLSFTDTGTLSLSLSHYNLVRHSLQLSLSLSLSLYNSARHTLSQTNTKLGRIELIRYLLLFCLHKQKFFVIKIQIIVLVLKHKYCNNYIR